MSEPTPVQQSSAAETSISPALMELNLKKETLLLRKLELDNEEQQARIAQLRLQWWQKPKLLISISVSALAFVGFLVKNVVQDGINQAKILNQQSEIENQRLEFLQKQLRPRVAELEAAEEKLIDSAFRRYTDVCEIGGRIAAAEDVKTAEQIFTGFGKILTADAEIDEAIQQIKECLADWKKHERPPELDRVRVAAAVLRLSYACKTKFQKNYANQFPQAVRKLTIEIYREAIEVAKELKGATDRRDATVAVERFYELYYGKLILVESKSVEGAMVHTNNELPQWTQGPPNRPVFGRLINSLTKEADQLAKQQSEELASRERVMDKPTKSIQ